jgi:dGTPase
MNNTNIFIANQDFAQRLHPEKEHSFRSCFERDRDRILYSKEFRRLNRKTQVFIAGFDDHVRNRLIHTLEVAQISETIASHLDLNVSLTTAIAYGHDVGHTPFGHVGERTLNYFMNGCRI